MLACARIGAVHSIIFGGFQQTLFLAELMTVSHSTLLLQMKELEVTNYSS